MKKESYKYCMCYKCAANKKEIYETQTGPDCACEFEGVFWSDDTGCKICPKKGFCDIALHPDNYESWGK